MASITRKPLATSRRGGSYWVNYGRGLEEVRQGAYRRAVASMAQGMTRSQRVTAIASSKGLLLSGGVTGLSDRQLAMLAGKMLDTKGRIDALPEWAQRMVSDQPIIWSIARNFY